ncbi:unnamed protein product, partial [Amoebophrya sp. A25]
DDETATDAEPTSSSSRKDILFGDKEQQELLQEEGDGHTYDHVDANDGDIDNKYNYKTKPVEEETPRRPSAGRAARVASRKSPSRFQKWLASRNLDFWSAMLNVFCQVFSVYLLFRDVATCMHQREAFMLPRTPAQSGGGGRGGLDGGFDVDLMTMRAGVQHEPLILEKKVIQSHIPIRGFGECLEPKVPSLCIHICCA